MWVYLLLPFLLLNELCINAGVIKLLEKCGVMIWHAMTKYEHTDMAFIEALNKLLAEQLFKIQDAQDLNNP